MPAAHTWDPSDPVLNLEFAHGRSGVQPTVENLPKDRHGSGGFLRWIFGCKMQKKNPPENPPAETKKSAGARPPEIRQPRPKSATKPYQQIHLSNLKVHAGFFRLRRIALGGVFRAWILGHSLAAFWAWSRLPC